jgi:hypothetical protein
MLMSVKRIAVLALLFVLPLQGLAINVAPVMCLSGGDHHHAIASTSDDAAEHHSHSHNHEKSDSSTSDVAQHLECHHVFSGVPVSFPPFTAPDLPAFQATISSAATLYIPELPQRPPRT